MRFHLLTRESVSELLSPEYFDELVPSDAFLSQGKPLDDERFLSVKIGTLSITFSETAIFKCAHALSLMPDLSERIN